MQNFYSYFYLLFLQNSDRKLHQKPAELFDYSKSLPKVYADVLQVYGKLFSKYIEIQ